MAKEFNIQGGYFSPPGYLKVETGGSHDENPNGGVQIGVDPNGIPNMLEEGEPVYDDYVYSDNITADKTILKQFNIPEKYAGKLYSEIADVFVDEAEDRPLDSISNNGLRAMLGRLANAQEQQKQEEEQKALEKELEQLSPEELDELEAMLAAQKNAAPVQPEQAVVPEQAQMPVEGMPQEMQPQLMAMGGLLRRFDGGTPGQIVVQETPPPTGTIEPYIDTRTVIRKAIDNMIDNSSTLRSVQRGFRNFSESAPGQVIGMFLPDLDSESGGVSMLGGSPLIREAGRVAGPAARSIGRGLKKAGDTIKNIPKKVAEVAGRKQMVAEAGAAVKEARTAAKSAKDAANAVASELETAKAALKASPSDKSLLQKVAELEAQSAKADAAALKASAKATGVTLEAGVKTAGAFTTGPLYNRAALEQEVSGLRTAYETAKKAAEAAPKDKALQEAAQEALKKLEKAEGAWNKWWNHGEWQLKGAIAGGAIGSAAASGHQTKKKNWVESQFADGGLMRRFDMGTPGRVYKEDGTEYNIGDVSDTLGTFLGYDDNGVAMFDAGELSSVPFIVDRITKSVGSGTDTTATSADTVAAVAAQPEAAGASQARTVTEGGQTGAGGNGTTNPVINPAMLPTWPRYVGALNSGIMGLYNAFQQPDRYSIPRYNPVLPEGRMDLVDPIYNPLDQNMAINDVLAGSAGSVRALRDAGLGPSTGAVLLAADYNAGRNMGTARTQVWDANNQRRNQVFAMRNANAQALANYNYGQSRDRAQIQNDTLLRNIQNDLMQQRLNYAAEGEKYTALQSNIEAMSKALAGIGRENFAMNQINSDTAYDYVALPGGGYAYVPKTRINTEKAETEKKEDGEKRRGGRLLRPYKKK